MPPSTTWTPPTVVSVCLAGSVNVTLIGMLIAARILQGIATGAAIGAVGAGMLDLDAKKGTIANAVAPVFKDGAWLVELASITDGASTASAVATVLGIKIGEADVRFTDARCQQSVLVQ